MAEALWNARVDALKGNLTAVRDAINTEITTKEAHLAALGENPDVQCCQELKAELQQQITSATPRRDKLTEALAGLEARRTSNLSADELAAAVYAAGLGSQSVMRFLLDHTNVDLAAWKTQLDMALADAVDASAVEVALGLHIARGLSAQ